MFNIKDAAEIVRKFHPFGDIQAVVVYQNLYLFKVFNKSPGEQEMDPFFSVDMETGDFKEFSILTDGDTTEIVSLFNKVGR